MHVNPLTWCIYGIVAVKRRALSQPSRAGPRKFARVAIESHLSAKCNPWTLPGCQVAPGPFGPAHPWLDFLFSTGSTSRARYIKSTCDTNINLLSMLFLNRTSMSIGL
ncbi:hypothetical protein ACN42_g4188 [Penicillium freii]|uniref:Uncharacterized protein n=1 Tax=Penicillium freii TaxID=48697 RepID=A0A101MLT7_PENFR|nr:hypothetical protein ACN42_g4188 [Penicillium freii]